MTITRTTTVSSTAAPRRASAGQPTERFERSQADEIADLRARLAKLERELHPPPAPPETDAEREARYVREGGGH